MNLFILDRQPEHAAQYYGDGNIRRTILDAVEMMGYAYSDGEFKPLPSLLVYGHQVNHQMSQWVRASTANFDWTLQHTQALLDEFAYRHPQNKQHAYRQKVDWIANNLPLHNLTNFGLMDWPRCFDKFQDMIEITNDAVYDYRRYYMLSQKHLAKWTKRAKPDWYRF